MLLTRTANASVNSPSRLARGLAGVMAKTIDRRTFLKRSGITAGAAGIATQLPFNVIGIAEAKDDRPAGKMEVKRTVCTHCSVGCAIDAYVENGVWVRQEPVFDSPINLGAHCAKGASVREHGITHDSHRLKYPMKLEGGKWKRVSWDQAYDDISKKMLEIRKQSGPDSLFVVGSSKHNNEQSELLCKWARLWGTNNTDHQARICHSTTVAGVAQTWGYGAMTNSYNDEQNSKSLMFLGSNAAEAHPVSMLHTLHAKENGCKVIVVDPRYTRTAAKADMYVRHRSGSDVAFLFGVLHHVFKNGWEDKDYIAKRVYGMDKIKEEVMAKWTPDKVTEVTGVSEAEVFTVAKTLAEKPPRIHHLGNGPDAAQQCQRSRARIEHPDARARQRRAARAVDATSTADTTTCRVRPTSARTRTRCPGYYPVAVPGSWAHWARVWNVDLKWLTSQYASPAMMAKPGMTVSRWIDGVLEKNEAIDQDPNLRMIFYWGHAPNSQTRGPEMLEAMKKLDLMVVLDPYPSASAAMFAMVRKDGAYLLPIATQFETDGSATCSNRSLQWREKVIEPLFESRTDQMVMYQLAVKLGFGDQFVGKKDGKQTIKLVKGKGGMDEPSMEDALREINRGAWTIGYTGQSPERLQAHMRNMHVFDVKTLKARGGKDAKTGYDLTGDYYGLPWPCFGTAAIKHPGSPNLYDNSKHVMDGGGNFRALFGMEKDGVNLLAEDGSHPKGAEITTGHPQFDHVLLKKLGWWDDLTEEEKKEAEGQDVGERSVGRHPARRAESMAAILSAMRRRAPWCGTSRIRSRCIANRCTAPAPIWSRSIRPTTT
jgi:formate dehydrogenase major subunit